MSTDPSTRVAAAFRFLCGTRAPFVPVSCKVACSRVYDQHNEAHRSLVAALGAGTDLLVHPPVLGAVVLFLLLHQHRERGIVLARVLVKELVERKLVDVGSRRTRRERLRWSYASSNSCCCRCSRRCARWCPGRRRRGRRASLRANTRRLDGSELRLDLAHGIEVALLASLNVRELQLHGLYVGIEVALDDVLDGCRVLVFLEDRLRSMLVGGCR